MQEKLFFLTSKRAAKRLTDAFDFVWPTAAAIWNLRWQVSGYIAVAPEATESELLGRFVAGSNIRGANLRRACVNSTWQDQEQEFARFLLVEFCALYETWCEGALDEIKPTKKGLNKELQYPSTLKGGVAKGGVGYALQVIATSPSIPLSTALYPKLKTNRKYSKSKIEQLLICYRYFKELRNSMVHAGGLSSGSFKAAESAYDALTATALGVHEKPQHLPQTAANDVILSLRGIVGFGEIVLRLISTLDIEIAQSKCAEEVFIRRWKSKHGGAKIVLPADKHDRNSRICKLVKQIDLPKPKITSHFENWLKVSHLVH